VFGTLFGALVRMLGSHTFLPGTNNRFVLERAAAGELLRFGRWIFVSTVLSFTTNSAASLILGKFLSMAEVGIFAIACTLSKAVEQAYEQVSSRVLLPAFARLKHEPLPHLRSKILRLRSAMLIAFVPALLMLAIFGQQVMELLFDERYRSGGWILQLYSACAIPIIVTGVSQFALAKGNSALVMWMSALRLVFYVGASMLGWWLAGANGIVVGIAVHSFLTYLAELAVQRHYGIQILWLDALAFAAAAAVLALGWTLVGIQLPAGML
jgi:O-antigen/teichoic acid export membrane protein